MKKSDKEYIETQTLKDDILSLDIMVGGKSIFSDDAKSSVLRVIDEQPTVDVVEKDDCEKCKYFPKNNTQYPCNMCSNCYTSKFQPKE